MLDNFRMNGIKFIKYDPLNKEHFVYLQEFSIDEKKHNYYPCWQDFLSAYINNNANNNEIVYLLKTNENFIGICTVDLDEEARAVIAVGLLSKCNSLLYNQVRGTIVKYLQDNKQLSMCWCGGEVYIDGVCAYVRTPAMGEAAQLIDVLIHRTNLQSNSMMIRREA